MVGEGAIAYVVCLCIEYLQGDGSSVVQYVADSKTSRWTRLLQPHILLP